MPNGTLDINDLKYLATIPVIGNEVRIYDMLTASLNVHNRLLAEKMGDWAEDTTERQESYGTFPEALDLDEMDEYGAPDAAKALPASYPVGYPLRRFGKSLQWTRSYFVNATAADLAAQVTNLQDASLRNADTLLRRAIFRPTNYPFVDRLVNSATLYVKALINADGSAIPLGQNGESFDGATHTHYVGSATLTTAAVDALIETVLEHNPQGQPEIRINRAQEAAFRALTGFTAYVDARIVQPLTATYAAGRTVDFGNPNKRAIGIYGAAEVLVDNTLIPANYVLCRQPNAAKVLKRRVRNAGGGGLQLVYEDENNPLRARTLEQEFGFGVFGRTSAAVLYIGSASYVQPTI